MELVFTVAIVGILAMVAMPSYERFVTNSQLDAAARSLQTALILTRSEAVKRNAEVHLVQSGADDTNDWSAGFAVSTLTTREYSECVASAPNDCIRVFDPLPAGILVTPVVTPSTEVDQVTYRLTGRTNADTGNLSFTLCPTPLLDGIAERIISIGTTGLPEFTYGDDCE